MVDYIEYYEKVEWTLSGKPKVWLIPTKREPLPADARCKFCGSRDLVRYGRYRGIQRYLCQECGRKGANNRALPRMQVPPEVIGAAISMFYEGMPLSAISRQLWQIYRIQPSRATIYGWVTKYTKKAKQLTADSKLKRAREWVVDETVLKVGGKKTWFWDILDSNSRYLIASHLSETRGTKDAETIMKHAQGKTEKPPEFIISDKLAAYVDGIERVFGADTWHIQAQGLAGRINTNLVERFHGTLKSRTKIMRGLKGRRTARLITDGWLFHYNHFRPHEALGKRTPAQVAGIKFPHANWTGIVKDGEVP